MVSELREMCRREASYIPGWEKMTKSELCRLCIQNESNTKLYNSYFAAVLYNYCNTISRYHSSCGGLVDIATCTEWVVDAIQYALSHRRWEDPDSSIYNDQNGPDKVINRILKCTRANLYQYVNRKKRRDAYGMKSLEAIMETVNDSSLELADNEDIYSSTDIDLEEYIKGIFKRKDYFTAYLLDCILNEKVMVYNKDTNEYEFNKKRLARILCSLGKEYCIRFACTYNLPTKDVLDTLKYFSRMRTDKILYKVEFTIKKLRHDKEFLNHLKGAVDVN